VATYTTTWDAILGEASDQLRLALCDLSLGSTVASSDPET